MARTVQIPIVKFATTPNAPSVTNIGTAGSASRSWVVVGTDSAGAKTAASPVGSTSTGNATPNGSNFDRLNWSAVPGAVSYDVYRTVGGVTGKIASGLVANTFDDTGIAGDSTTTAPSTNGTGIGAPVTVGDIKDFVFQVDGVFVGTLTLEAQQQGASGWVALSSSSLPATGPALVYGVGVPPAIDFVRARMTAYTSGTPAVWCRGNGRV